MPLFFSFILFSISPSFSFIDANPARSSSSIPMMLVSSVCNRLCVLSLSFFIFLSTCSFLRVCLCLVVLVIGRRIWMKKSSGLLYDQAVFLYPSRVFFPPVFSLFIGRYANISENTSATTATTTTTRKAKGGYAVLCYLDNDDSSHAHRPAGFMSSLLPRAPELTWPVGQNIY